MLVLINRVYIYKREPLYAIIVFIFSHYYVDPDLNPRITTLAYTAIIMDNR